MNFSRSVWFGLLGFALVLSACSVPEQDDPFSRLPEENLEVVTGEVFPFSVSVSTRATHRLEKDKHLVAYLASDIVRLEDFEGREVRLEGVFRKEKMREIFWVEKVELQDGENNEESTEERFTTKRFTFVHPLDWEYTLAPNGMAYFLGKTDPARRVFLTFSVEDLTREDKRLDPNVLIANMAGVKDIKIDEFNRDREEIVLFSNLYPDKKYRFVFTNNFEDFEKKKSFFRLLSTFTEGEENVQRILREEQKALASAEGEKAKKTRKDVAEVGAEKAGGDETVIAQEKGTGLLRKLFGKPKDEEADAIDQVSGNTKEVAPAQKGDLGGYKNLITASAFPYESSYYKFSMKVPFGYWFRNFGPTQDALDEIAFANYDFNQRSRAQFFLWLVQDDTPPTELIERVEDGQLILEWPRTGKSFYRMQGPPGYRDAMRSVQATVRTL